MTKEEILNMFRAKRDIRTWMMRPFRLNGFVYACNGHWMVRVPDEAGLDADHHGEKHPKNIEAMYAQAAEEGFMPLPAIEKPEACFMCEGRGFGKIHKCGDCDGEGDFAHGNHWYECKECEGAGDTFEATHDGTDACPQCGGLTFKWGGAGVPVGDQKFSPTYIYLLAQLPGMRFANNADKTKAGHFFFDGGEGLVMPYRD